MATTTPKMSPIDVDDIDVQPFSFIKSMAPGETIASAVVTCELDDGNDPSPGSVLVGSPTIDGSMVRQTIQGNVADATYHIRCRAVLSSGREIVVAGLLPCVRR